MEPVQYSCPTLGNVPECHLFLHGRGFCCGAQHLKFTVRWEISTHIKQCSFSTDLADQLLTSSIILNLFLGTLCEDDVFVSVSLLE